MSMSFGFRHVGQRRGALRKIAAAVSLLAASPAMAATDANVTVTGVGSSSGNLGFLYVSPNTSGGCGGSLLYIDLATDWGRGILSIALTARAAGKPLARIDYSVATGAMCWVTLIQM